MPVISGPTPINTTTAQDIIDGCTQDVRQVLSSGDTGSQNIVLDYINRVVFQILRNSAWDFMISPTQSFITQTGVNDYWIGYQAGNVLGSFDTGLGLNDVRAIKEDEVFDRTNFNKLFKVRSSPLAASLEFPDGSARPGRPKQWAYDPVDAPYVLKIYPAPDNQSTYQPVPDTPICVAITTAGSLPARFYYVNATFTDSFGNESSASFENKVFVPANMLLTVQPPQPPAFAGSLETTMYQGGSSTGVRYDRYNIYASTTSSNETFQTGPISTNSSWTEPTSGITTTGPIFPTTNNLEPVDGYLIQFKYYRDRLRLTTYDQVIQVPDDYRDVVIAGVNGYINEYLRRPADAQRWMQLFQMGLVTMRRDQNMYPKYNFIRTDPATINTNYPAVEVTDPSITRTN